MALRLYKLLSKDFFAIFKPSIRSKSQRRCLGKPPGTASSLQERLDEMNYVDPKIFYNVDIGFPLLKKLRRNVLSEHISVLKKNKSDPEMERLARKNKLVVPLEEVEEEWKKSIGPLQIKTVADHYSIFEDLFGDAYFLPNTPLDVCYEEKYGYAPVYRGNHLKPNQVKQAPEIRFNATDDSLWTLVMCTPDGHFTDGKAEYVHWFVGNIKGGEISSGEEIFSYLQPFPVKGAGYFRYIFILYKQNKHLNYSALKENSKSVSLDERTFKTYDFYRERQDFITPAGLAFFQADWDDSVTSFFHDVLQISEPEYCYDFPEPYHPKQEWFPLKKPFNLYMDRYRDEKQIAKEYLLKKLKNEHPFKGPEPPLQFPNAIPFKKGTPSWLKLEIRKQRLGWGRVQDY